MQYQPPYIVQHIFLNEKNLEISSISKNGYGHYFVFWWKDIPLGHLFVEQNEELTNSNLKAKVLEVIAPVIDHYIVNQKLETICKHAYNDNDFPLFSKTMDKILSNYLPSSLPKKVDISVIICTRNRSMYLQDCIDSLLKQTCLPREIIVIDNAPSDDSTEKLVKRYNLITYYKEVRAGLDIARNTGAKMANFPIVAYIDDDVELHSLWAYRLAETFLSGHVDAMTGLIIASSLDTESEQIFEKHWGFNKGYRNILYDRNFLKTKVPRVWEIGAGANMAFRKTLLEKVGYFDERLDVGAAGCNGDSEIWYRILSQGHIIKYNPLAVSHHKHRKELSALRMQLFSYMRGHATAALIQHEQNKKAGYKKYIYFDIIRHYLLLIRIGFPSYSSRYKTLWSEIKGIISGIRFFNKNKNTARIIRSN